MSSHFGTSPKRSPFIGVISPASMGVVLGRHREHPRYKFSAMVSNPLTSQSIRLSHPPSFSFSSQKSHLTNIAMCLTKKCLEHCTRCGWDRQTGFHQTEVCNARQICNLANTNHPEHNLIRRSRKDIAAYNRTCLDRSGTVDFVWRNVRSCSRCLR